jgi:hypothetical protein
VFRGVRAVRQTHRGGAKALNRAGKWAKGPGTEDAPLLRPAPGGMFTTNRQDRAHTRPRSDSLTYRYSSATNARAAPTAIPRASRAISPATRWRFTYSPLSYAGPGSGCNDNPARFFPLPRSARFSYAASSLETATPTTSRPDAQHPAGVLSVAEPWSGVRDWYAGHKGGVHGTVAAGIKTVDRAEGGALP